MPKLTATQAQIVKTASEALATIPEEAPTAGYLTIVDFHPTAAASVRLVFEGDSHVKVVLGSRGGPTTGGAFYSDGTQITFANVPAIVVESTIIALTKYGVA